jgi:pSer/pThr/pTyr-binding forkhead associated (FHA) protein
MECPQCGTELAPGTKFCSRCGAAVEGPRLLITAGPARGHGFALQGRMRIGRDPANDIVLAEEGVSPYHAQITPDAGGWTLQDFGGPGGTIVNGERVVGAADLKSGDRIAIGSSVLVLQADSGAARPPTQASPTATTTSKSWLRGKSPWLIAAAVVGFLSMVACCGICMWIGIVADTDTSATDDTQPVATAAVTQTDPSEHISPDQGAVLDVNGPPQAFTVYLDPISGSIFEEWSYYTLGQEINFTDGSYEGGVDAPLPEIDESAPIPDPAAYPWQILQNPTPDQVVKLAGPALFRTSAFVLPGWNDDYQVARLWILAGGGDMITVDGVLAMASIDTGYAMDEALFQVSELFVGTLGEGEDRLGAILSPGGETGTYRLSLSPRGQGTTQAGTEVVFDLKSSSPEGAFTLGTNAFASVVEYDGSEKRAQASGMVIITTDGNTCKVSVNTRVDDRALVVSGRMRSGLWTVDDGAGFND